MGYATEAFVFSYLGLTFFSYGDLKWSPALFGIELLVIVVGRGLGTAGLIGLMSMCGYKSGMNAKEIIFIWYAGMIRGAIAFGLVLRIDKDSYKNRDVIVTTSLSLVIFTTVVFGSTVGLLQRCLFSKKSAEEPVNQIQSTPLIQCESDENSADVSYESSYQRMMHPNEERKAKPHTH